MKYYSKQVVELIENEIDKTIGKKILIKVENFQELSLYSEICNKLKKRCLSKGIDLVIKLSNGKYFENKDSKQKEIEYFIKENWVDLENHMTNYRNMSVNKKTIILLLATEMVEDRGGLEDFFLISPETIDRHVGEKYHLFFSEKYDNGSIDGYDDIIDKIFKSIFNYYPKNLFKLSCLVDELTTDIENIDQLVNLIFSRLYNDWNIPRILTIPSRTQLKKGKKISILEKSIKFARRSDFKDLNKPKLNKLEKKLEKFEQESLNKCKISGDDFIKLKINLLEYAKGKNLDKVRQNLFNMDFDLLDKILQLKLTKSKSLKKDKKISLRGEVFEVISKALLITISNYLNEEKESQLNINNVEISFSEVGIAEISEFQDELYSVWRNICNYSGGILKFINKEGFLINNSGEEVELKYEIGKEFFSLVNADALIEAGILKRLAVTKKLSSIKFSIKLNVENECLYSNEVEWKFKNNEDWLMSFSFLNSEFQDEVIGGDNIPFIPSGTIKNIEAFLHLNDEEEFFDLLEKNELDLSTNICKQKLVTQSEFNDTFQLLGLAFNRLLKKIYKTGLFNSINQGDISTFLNKYKNSIELLKEEKISQNNKEIMEMFIKFFSVVDVNEKIESGLEISSAIIPPYHPAILEKIQEKYLFLRSGLLSLLKVIIKNPKGSQKIINEKLRIFNDLSSIQSSVDVLIGLDKKYLDTKGVYGLYTILSSKQIEITSHKKLDYNTILKKENALTDEGIQYKKSSDSRLISKIIKDYINIYPSSIDGLKLSFINPRELQPIISSLNSLINESNNSLLKDEVLKITLNIFSNEENIGGKSYLAYWIENIFEEDSSIDIKIYYNTHSNKESLENNINRYLDEDTDLIFITDLLEEKDVEFRRVKNIKLGAIESKFPMIFKPLPIRKESYIRSIELSQPQFTISTAHSNLVCKIKEGNDSFNEKSLIKDYSFTKRSRDTLNKIKEIGNWTICLDKGIDQYLISKLDNNNIIGFFPGQGAFGEYNLTISGKNNALKTLNKRLQTRLKKSFKELKKDELETISNNCLNVINELNGSRILRALNVNDYAINDFLAYFLTHSLLKNDEKCWGLIPLDFHHKWFSEISNRPDFLKFEVKEDMGEKIKIKATIIECKLANESSQHKEKALRQIEEGYKALKNKFSENSTLIEKRYWFAQLYKNMIYSEMLELKCNDKYSSLSDNLFKILEGEFEMEWEGQIFTYWVNSEEQEISIENITSSEDININCIEVPRIKIKTLLKKTESFKLKNLVKKSNKNTKIEPPKTEKTVKIETKINIISNVKPITEKLEKFESNNKLSNTEKIITDLEIDSKFDENIIENETIESVKISNEENISISERLISTLDIQEENNDINNELIYAKEKLKDLCLALRKNKLDVDPYLNNNDKGIVVGPNFIKLKLKLDIGTSISKLEKFNKDMKLWLSLNEIPIIYADKGFAAVEIPRQNNLTIKLGNILSKHPFEKLKNGLQFVLGIDEEYNPCVVNLADSNNPHLLIAGSTGGGKSVLINSIIVNLMTQYSPNELEFIFIDPKKVELSTYKGSPYLKGREVSKSSETALNDLMYAIKKMENRYELLEKNNVKNIDEYNLKVENIEKLPRVLIIVDEFANFMEDKEYKTDIESSIKRISAEARAAGIHMIISTQSPRGDVITTTIRNNLGARVALRVPDHSASNLILGMSGAENLKGKGDMLFNSPSSSESKRLKSPFISNKELENFLKESKEIYKG